MVNEFMALIIWVVLVFFLFAVAYAIFTESESEEEKISKLAEQLFVYKYDTFDKGQSTTGDLVNECFNDAAKFIERKQKVLNGAKNKGFWRSLWPL